MQDIVSSNPTTRSAKNLCMVVTSVASIIVLIAFGWLTAICKYFNYSTIIIKTLVKYQFGVLIPLYIYILFVVRHIGVYRFEVLQ